MEIKNISILGNTIAARMFGLSIAIPNPNIHIKIFTNNEEFKNNIRTPTMFQNQLNMTLSYYFEEELDIPSEDIFKYRLDNDISFGLHPIEITDDAFGLDN